MGLWTMGLWAYGPIRAPSSKLRNVDQIILQDLALLLAAVVGPLQEAPPPGPSAID